ncbi:hypothetical protein BHE74_00008103 [Ensete ventricosum]|nr:hypothetical protein GW17_00039766 [Ensete ventricosum]RWW83394.1 hypothetical protein BHE74_00008103 [Ensete ventricosum]
MVTLQREAAHGLSWKKDWGRRVQSQDLLDHCFQIAHLVHVLFCHHRLAVGDLPYFVLQLLHRSWVPHELCHGPFQ